MSTNRLDLPPCGRVELSRRGFFSRFGDGLQGAALASLLSRDLYGAEPGRVYDLAPRAPHFPAKAKSVIHLFMNGGPSQVDLFDPKPALTKFAGSAPPRDLASQIEFTDQAGGILPSPFRFQRYGKSGIELSELLPGLGEVVDDVTLVRSMFGEHFNHEPSIYLMQTGRTIPGRPALGSWFAYGLGSENRNLPAYVVLDDPKGLPINGIQNWQAGWLPPVYQGTRFRSEGSPLLNLKTPADTPEPVAAARRKLLRQLDEAHRGKRNHQPDLDARIASYELAARMQITATDALDLSQETEATREMYGLNNPATQSYGKRCLMARRLVERGVRFVQLYIEGQIWDNHSDLETGLRYACGKTDKPVAALIKDLKRMGLLDSTLVMWGGEFGRMPVSQSRENAVTGRDHGPAGFTMWLAGGGVKRGLAYGATDELGHKAVENRVSVHDMHATMLHLAGLNSRELVFDREGLKDRLTDQYPARVVKEILV
ncbi:MAG: DUF1501 domain-containing protein [Acidobacteria bacterium]|nr:DUF1501 domain-containing protein [Acidobacteriota bacterium]